MYRLVCKSNWNYLEHILLHTNKKNVIKSLNFFLKVDKYTRFNLRFESIAEPEKKNYQIIFCWLVNRMNYAIQRILSSFYIQYMYKTNVFSCFIFFWFYVLEKRSMRAIVYTVAPNRVNLI